MPTPVAIHSATNKWIYEGSFTVTTSGAIVPDADSFTTTDPEIVCTRTGTGTYRLDIRGNFKKVIAKAANLNGAGTESSKAEITAVSLGGGTATAFGEAVTTVTIKTLTPTADASAASATAPIVFAAADLATGTVSFRISFQKQG
jgi:hypothetical protein